MSGITCSIPHGELNRASVDLDVLDMVIKDSRLVELRITRCQPACIFPLSLLISFNTHTGEVTSRENVQKRRLATPSVPNDDDLAREGYVVGSTTAHHDSNSKKGRELRKKERWKRKIIKRREAHF